jgi:hypothetical protein
MLTVGHNNFGQLGRSTASHQLGEVLAREPAVDVVAAGNCTGVVTSSERLVMFGDKVAPGGVSIERTA